MKKSYLSPAVKEVEIDSKDCVMAGSPPRIETGEGNVDGSQAWTNRRRSVNDWDNIWSN